MKILRCFAVSLILFIQVTSTNAITVTHSGEFDLADGTLAGLLGVHFDATFIYDTTTILDSFSLTSVDGVPADISKYKLGSLSDVAITVAGFSGLSFTDDNMKVVVENDWFFGGFDWIPEGLTDFYHLDGVNSPFDMSNPSNYTGLNVSLIYAGNTAMFTNSNLASDLTADIINNPNIYDPGFAILLTEIENGVEMGSAFWNIGSASAVPVPASVWLFSSGLMGLIGIGRLKKS